MLAVASTLSRLRDEDRELYLFDTFEGMTPPSLKDVDFAGGAASDLLSNQDRSDDASCWCVADLELVRRTLGRCSYPSDKLHFVKGRVEETIPALAPAEISILRLDTDWYESTRHELVHLFPRLVKGGVLIIDDYGHWEGARLATDEYFSENNHAILLNRIDYTGRIGVKA